MKNQWIIFDAMGVIFEVGDDTNDLLVPYIQVRKPMLKSKVIQEAYLKASLGKISSLKFWNIVGLQSVYPFIEQEYLERCLTIDPNFMDTAVELTQNYSLAILSNDIKEWSSYLRIKFGLNAICKTVVISGDVGCRKPEPKIYNILLQRLQVPAYQCVYIDDNVKNLAPAFGMGMKVVHFMRDSVAGEGTIFPKIHSIAELPNVLQSMFSSRT